MKLFIIIIFLVLIYYLFVFISNFGCKENFAESIEVDKYSGYCTKHKTAINFPLPPGEWKEKCDLINWKHPYLWARCYDDKRRPHNNVINIHSCEDETIHVHNGHLECH